MTDTPTTPVAPQAAPVVQPAPPTNILAIIALVASCIGFTVPGIVLGHVALYQIRRTGEAGHSLAVAALIVGYILFGLSILIVIGYIIFIVFVLGTFAATSSSQIQNFG